VRSVFALAATLACACNQREPPKSNLPARAGSASPTPADAATVSPPPAPTPAPPAPTPAPPAPTPPARPGSDATDPDLEIVTTGLPRDRYHVEHRDGDQYMITSTPPADVYIDGVLVGVTPLMFQIRPGKHRIELRVAGH
jgi:hypothetical protein